MNNVFLMFNVLKVPEIRNEILRQYSGKWTKIAKKQMKTVFSQSSAAMRDQAKRYNNRPYSLLISRTS